MRMNDYLHEKAIAAGIKPESLEKISAAMQKAKSNRVSCTLSNSKCGPLVLHYKSQIYAGGYKKEAEVFASALIFFRDGSDKQVNLIRCQHQISMIS